MTRTRISRAQDNARSITRVLENRGYADLYRTAVAGPSGQRKDVLIARVQYIEMGAWELEILSPPSSLEPGSTAGYASRIDPFARDRHPGMEWVIYEYIENEGTHLLGYASSLATGADVLFNGVHAATGRHDSARISPGRWESPGGNTVMTVQLTPKRQALLDAMRAKAEDGWTHIPDHSGYCIRWDRVRDFPDHMRRWPDLHGGYPYRNWAATYTQHVFITMATATSVLMTVHSAPWMTGSTRDLTIKRALEILADPASS